MSYKILEWLTWGITIVILFPLGLIFQNFYRQSTASRWLAISLLFSLTCDLTAKVLLWNKINPNYAGNFYWVFNPLLISVFFFYAIAWNSLKKTLIAVNAMYFVFAMINVLFIQKLNINSYNQIFQSILILVLSICFYYKLLKELPTQKLQTLPLFWIVSGFFFSYAGKLVLYSVLQYLVEYLKDNLLILWILHNFLTLIANSLIAYGVWLSYKELTTPKKTSLERVP